MALSSHYPDEIKETEGGCIGVHQWLRAFVALKEDPGSVLSTEKWLRTTLAPVLRIQPPPLTSVDAKHPHDTQASIRQDAHTHKGVFFKVWERASETAQWAKVPVPRLTMGV